jgi:glycosyltransferase involved in cell wall biosynthesis
MVFHTDNIRQSYHTPIEQLKGPNTVIETDFSHLPLNKVYAKMYYSDIIVHPALTEGFGLPILESFNLSKPLVCVNAPGINELANDKNSFMVTNVKPKIIDVPLWIKFKAVDYDAKDLAYQIELAMDNSKEVLEDKIKNGLETVKRYYNIYDRFTEIYKKIRVKITV